MRIWHYALLPYLSKLQFDGQLRELVAIRRDWETKGTTNHLLINRVMDYSRTELMAYFNYYAFYWQERYKTSINEKYVRDFWKFCPESKTEFHLPIFEGWHNKEYLRVCMANLYEKYHFGVGKSKITQEEWNRILQGYKEITGSEYVI